MEIFRKIMLGAGVVSFCICGLFLNGMGGVAMTMYGSYAKYGYSLLLSTLLFGGALGAALSRKPILNALSLMLNIFATVLWIYPIAGLSAVPNSIVPKESMEVLTGHIYPAVIITMSLGLAVFADIFSPGRIAEREKKREAKDAMKNRPLEDNEKIV
ncbi:MAG: hypothetical protein NC078_06050 [Ruminococcus sp.]|nr:hypothetical protein [Ruminococcus sp.]